MKREILETGAKLESIDRNEKYEVYLPFKFYAKNNCDANAFPTLFLSITTKAGTKKYVDSDARQLREDVFSELKKEAEVFRNEIEKQILQGKRIIEKQIIIKATKLNRVSGYVLFVKTEKRVWKGKEFIISEKSKTVENVFNILSYDVNREDFFDLTSDAREIISKAMFAKGIQSVIIKL